MQSGIQFLDVNSLGNGDGLDSAVRSLSLIHGMTGYALVLPSNVVLMKTLDVTLFIHQERTSGIGSMLRGGNGNMALVTPPGSAAQLSLPNGRAPPVLLDMGVMDGIIRSGVTAGLLHQYINTCKVSGAFPAVGSGHWQCVCAGVTLHVPMQLKSKCAAVGTDGNHNMDITTLEFTSVE